MIDGIYSVTFTTTDGVMGNGTCMVAGDRYVGVDFTQSYHGRIRRYGAIVVVDMDISRHAFLHDIPLKLPLRLSLIWSGTVRDRGFDLEARFAETGDLIRATGVLLGREDGRVVPVALPDYFPEALDRG